MLSGNPNRLHLGACVRVYACACVCVLACVRMPEKNASL